MICSWQFLQIGGPFLGVLAIRALLFGVYIRATDFGNSVLSPWPKLLIRSLAALK